MACLPSEGKKQGTSSSTPILTGGPKPRRARPRAAILPRFRSGSRLHIGITPSRRSGIPTPTMLPLHQEQQSNPSQQRNMRQQPRSRNPNSGHIDKREHNQSGHEHGHSRQQPASPARLPSGGQHRQPKSQVPSSTFVDQVPSKSRPMPGMHGSTEQLSNSEQQLNQSDPGQQDPRNRPTCPGTLLGHDGVDQIRRGDELTNAHAPVQGCRGVVPGGAVRACLQVRVDLSRRHR
jgi:hypothetical protein